MDPNRDYVVNYRWTTASSGAARIDIHFRPAFEGLLTQDWFFANTLFFDPHALATSSTSNHLAALLAKLGAALVHGDTYRMRPGWPLLVLPEPDNPSTSACGN